MINDSSSVQKKCLLAIKFLKIFTIKSRKKSLARQLTVDFIIFIENFALVFNARDRWLDENIHSSEQLKKIYTILAVVVMPCQLGGIFLKIMLYLFCHPWSELIRNPENGGNDPEEINVMSNLRNRCKLNDEFKNSFSKQNFKNKN